MTPNDIGWTQEEWDRSAHKRLYEAYMAMAAVGYRPSAPSDGFGTFSSHRPS